VAPLGPLAPSREKKSPCLFLLPGEKTPVGEYRSLEIGPCARRVKGWRSARHIICGYTSFSREKPVRDKHLQSTWRDLKPPSQVIVKEFLWKRKSWGFPAIFLYYKPKTWKRGHSRGRKCGKTTVYKMDLNFGRRNSFAE